MELILLGKLRNYIPFSCYSELFVDKIGSNSEQINPEQEVLDDDCLQTKNIDL